MQRDVGLRVGLPLPQAMQPLPLATRRAALLHAREEDGPLPTPSGLTSGAAQLRAARAAAAAADAAMPLPPPCHPAPLAAAASTASTLHLPSSASAAAASAVPSATATGAATAAPAAPAPAPNKVEVVVAEIIEDKSCSRTNSAGMLVYKRYKRGRYLGKGGFAKCYELISLDSHRAYAGKIIAKASLVKQSARKKLLNEIRIHRSIQHQHVVKFERFFEDSTNVYILLEICPNHTLMELVKARKRLTETEVQVFMWQLVNTMIQLHAQKIIHRDLKLGNLFLGSDLGLRIGDFGLATQLSHPDERKRTICGTPNYIAPEILESSNGHSFEVDTWAMGVIMYTMLIGQPPFETASVKTTYKRIKDNAYEFPQNVYISPAARTLITRLLSASPSARPNLTAVRDDAFFTQSPFPNHLPLSCLHTPLQWQHSCHPPAVASIPTSITPRNDENATGGGNVMQSALPYDKLGGAARGALTARNPHALQNAHHGDVKHGSGALTARTTTSSKDANGKSVSPLSVAPPQPKRLSAAAIVPIDAPKASASMLPSPSPTYQSVEGQAKGFFKDLPSMPAGAPTPAPQQIAVPKRSSGERRPTRRSGERTAAEARDVDVLVSAVKQMGLAGGAKAEPIEIVVPESQPGGGAAEEEEDEEEKGAMKRMHDEIERSFCQPQSTTATKSSSVSSSASSSTSPSRLPLQPTDLWVNKWVDYSNKYGLGYLLSNGCSGVYFNDSSKAILSADGLHFDYIEKKPNGAASDRQQHTLDNFPPSLQKKVTLLKHFQSYLVHGSTNAETPTNAPASLPSPSAGSAADSIASAAAAASSNSSGAGLVYVKKWLRTRHALFFRLSNRTVQVVFQDQTELLLSVALNSVTYTDKSKRRETFPLERDPNDPNGPNERPDLAKRMKYTKDILQHLLTRSNPDVESSKQ